MKTNELKIVAVGDVIGERGALFLKRALLSVKRDYSPDLVIVNGENSDSRNGITKESAESLFGAGADIITTGNHVFKWRTFFDMLDSSGHIIRPANFPASCPGAGYTIKTFSGYRVLVMNVLGTLFMESNASPFETCEKILEKEKGNFDVSVCDIHAEATSEKAAFSRYFDGKISVIFGTHTHVQTADICILPHGTAFITDLGMCGVRDSVIGMDKDTAIRRMLTHIPSKYEIASGECSLTGAFFVVGENGAAKYCEPIQIDE